VIAPGADTGAGAQPRPRDAVTNLHRSGTVLRNVCQVTVLFATHESYLEHDTGPGHPERPARLGAVIEGASEPSLREAVVPLEPRPATRAELELVHPAWYLERLEDLAAAGGGWIDGDTHLGRRSVEAATLAAGAGLTAVDALRAGAADAAFCAVRPPGHHATRADAMGFCLVSSIAVVAASLAAAGERVWILDFDAHHGNGTQDVFFDDSRVLFVSLHQWPLYPGTGRLTETGVGAGTGTTLNVPLPPGTTGDVYLAAFDDVIAPVVEQFAPTWLLVSAGFDAHRDDPLTELGLTAGDYSLLMARALELAPPGRCVAMLEGGYDLDALAASTTAVISTLAGEGVRPEAPSSGGPGMDAVARARTHWSAL